MILATISARGNGLPNVGAYVPGDDGELYRVAALIGPIQTGQAGEDDWIRAQLEPADWSDIEDCDVFHAIAFV